MSDKPWSELTAREKDARVAKAMGWQLSDRRFYIKGTNQPESYDTPDTFCPTTDPAAARLVEDEIDDRDKAYWYLLNLYRITCGASDVKEIRFLHFHEIWFMLRATPEERCEAAVRVLEG